MHHRPFAVAVASIGLIFNFTSCASALKQRCESTNWFDHGELVAKRGQRTSTDDFVRQCETEEAKIDHVSMSQGFQKGVSEYCTPDFAYRLGKQGELLTGDLCAGGTEIRMRPKHAEGVREYCQAPNGEAAGAVGKKYNQICPKELEAAFLPEFIKGRKKYLTALVNQKQAEANDLDQEINRYERRRQDLRQDIQRLDWDKQRLQSQLSPSNSAQLDAASARTRNEMSSVETRLYNTQRDVSEVDSRIDSAQGKQRTLRQEAREAQAELSTL